jgi:hypothetical protein
MEIGCPISKSPELARSKLNALGTCLQPWRLNFQGSTFEESGHVCLNETFLMLHRNLCSIHIRRRFSPFCVTETLMPV